MQNATVIEIKQAYKRLAVQVTCPFSLLRSSDSVCLQLHPDKNPTTRKQAEDRFKLLAAAYETLSDATKRREYDEDLAEDERNRQQSHSTSSSYTYTSRNGGG